VVREQEQTVGEHRRSPLRSAARHLSLVKDNGAPVVPHRVLVCEYKRMEGLRYSHSLMTCCLYPEPSRAQREAEHRQDFLIERCA
jgi:hypothetical protein